MCASSCRWRVVSWERVLLTSSTSTNIFQLFDIIIKKIEEATILPKVIILSQAHRAAVSKLTLGPIGASEVFLIITTQLPNYIHFCAIIMH